MTRVGGVITLDPVDRKAGLQPHHRYGQQRDQLPDGAEQTAPDILPLLRARRLEPTPDWIKKISDMYLFDRGFGKLSCADLADPKTARCPSPANTKLAAVAGRPPQIGGANASEMGHARSRPRRRFLGGRFCSLHGQPPWNRQGNCDHVPPNTLFSSSLSVATMAAVLKGLPFAAQKQPDSIVGNLDPARGERDMP